MATLAIVVPAYRLRFLAQALASLAAQTVQDFTVYVGDDASPDDLRAACERWQDRLDLRYTRFEHNLGGRDLVAQWMRCVALSHEPWVWLFSDDDEMPPDAVQRVLDAVRAAGERTPLLHFNVDRIDAQGGLITAEPAFPPQLTARGFALRRLRFELSSYAPDYVFARAAFDAAGGFVPLPRGWCSDDATWISLAARGGLHTLDGARVRWRDSGDNISARHGADRPDKLRALVGFVRWLLDFLAAHPAAPGEPSDAELQAALRPWLMRQLRFLQLPLDAALRAEVMHALAGRPGFPAPALAWGLHRSNLRLAWRGWKQRRRQRG